MKDNQGQLRCLYEIAQKRMEWHPDIANKSRNQIKGCPRFDSKEKAELEYERMKRLHPDESSMVFTAIETDEEYYRIGSIWIIASDGEQIKAAEYVGMLSLGEYESLT